MKGSVHGMLGIASFITPRGERTGLTGNSTLHLPTPSPASLCWDLLRRCCSVALRGLNGLLRSLPSSACPGGGHRARACGSWGVGGFAVQLAKAANAFVIGTCSGGNKHYVQELGADGVIDYRTEDVFERAKAIAGDRGIDAIVDNIGPRNRIDNLRLLGPEGGLACIAGVPDLAVVPDLPYSIAIHDIGLGGVLVSTAFRRRQEDLGRMAAELMTLVQEGRIRSTVTEQITLEAIPGALERLAGGHVRGKDRCQSTRLIRDKIATADGK